LKARSASLWHKSSGSTVASSDPGFLEEWSEFKMTTYSLKRSRFISRRSSLAISVPATALLLVGLSVQLWAQAAGEGGNSFGFDMAPETSQRVVEQAVKEIPTPMAPGPVKPTWESLRENYKVPSWFVGAKFGIFMHFGIFSVPAHGSEWYEKFLYAGGNDSVLKVIGGNDMALHVNDGPKSTRAWHTEHFGPPEKFGYKDFIPMFRAEHFDADAWAALFRKAGARYVMPGAQHHENFAMWDSKVTPFNSVQMGPKRDVIGELAVAVRKQGMKLGIANHGIENFEFINPPLELAERMKAEKADLFDPKWADFYNYADRSDAAMRRFLVNWYERNVELIDKYQPDLIYFDNGVDQRHIDPLKLEIAAYYYNRAKSWGKEVSFTTKKAAFAPSGTNTKTIASILDFEGGPPDGIRTGSWVVDRPIGSSWGYIDGMKANSAETVIGWLVDTVSKNGTLLLNVSPKADGTIPQDQQETLLAVGKWLETNGEAIYDTHSWTQFEEKGKDHIYFTVKRQDLYAIVMGKSTGAEVTIGSLARGKPAGAVRSVAMLGGGSLLYKQDDAGLTVTLPDATERKEAFVLKIIGLKTNPDTNTTSGNPPCEFEGVR
jgi:alpha-L-fucosidase